MNKKVKMCGKDLIVAVLLSDLFQSRKKALIEDLDYETYCLVQNKNYGFTIPMIFYYDKMRHDLGLMIAHVAEYVTENGLFGLSNTLESKKCNYYMKYLISIRDYCIHANFRVNVMKNLSTMSEHDRNPKEAYDTIHGIINETYFSLFGYPLESFYIRDIHASNKDIVGVNISFYPTDFIFGPKNRLMLKL